MQEQAIKSNKSIFSILRANPWIFFIPFGFYLFNFLHTRILLFYQMSKMPEITPHPVNIEQHVESMKNIFSYISFFIESVVNLDFAYTGIFVGGLLIVIAGLIFIGHSFIFKKIRPFLSAENQNKLSNIQKICIALLCVLMASLIIIVLNLLVLKNPNIYTYLRFTLNPLIGVFLVLILSFLEAGFIWAVYKKFKQQPISLKDIFYNSFSCFPALYIFNLFIMFFGYLPSALQFVLKELITAGMQIPPRFNMFILQLSRFTGFGIPVIKAFFLFFPMIVVIEKKRLKDAILGNFGFMYLNTFTVFPFILFCAILIFIPMILEWIAIGFLNRLSLWAQAAELIMGTIFALFSVMVFLLIVKFYIRASEE